MLQPLAKNFVKTIKATGDVHFDVFRGWENIATHGQFMNIPHKIVWYRRAGGYHALHLFNCNFTLGTHTLEIDRITVPGDVDNAYLTKHGVTPQGKMLNYFYLGLAVDKSIEIAKKRKRSKLVINSELSGIADILVDRNFIVREGIRDRLNRGTEFRGSLDLRKPLKK